MFSTPETSVHVMDKNREISPLEREEGYGGKDLEISVRVICRVNQRETTPEKAKS